MRFVRSGFTLVELMIVVAIIGLLAALAVPNYLNMQYRSKRSELLVNVEAIRSLEIAYEGTNDTYLAEADWQPDATPGKVPRAFVSGTGFDRLGWRPSGAMRCSYRVTTSGTDFSAEGRCDVDGDGVQATASGSRLSETTMGTADTIY